jgi:hypothetical protein
MCDDRGFEKDPHCLGEVSGRTATGDGLNDADHPVLAGDPSASSAVTCKHMSTSFSPSCRHSVGTNPVTPLCRRLLCAVAAQSSPTSSSSASAFSALALDHLITRQAITISPRSGDRIYVGNSPYLKNMFKFPHVHNEGDELKIFELPTGVSFQRQNA